MYKLEGLDVSRRCMDCTEDACDDCYDDGFVYGADAAYEEIVAQLKAHGYPLYREGKCGNTEEITEWGIPIAWWKDFTGG